MLSFVVRTLPIAHPVPGVDLTVGYNNLRGHLVVAYASFPPPSYALYCCQEAEVVIRGQAEDSRKARSDLLTISLI
jgi:hypothetical protein